MQFFMLIGRNDNRIKWTGKRTTVTYEVSLGTPSPYIRLVFSSTWNGVIKSLSYLSNHG